MHFVQHDLGDIVVEADILRDTVECDRCGERIQTAGRAGT